MDTHRLRYFCTIAETGSLTKASEILGISHSGLSKAVSALEDETKLNLFKPQGRGLEITDEGKWFYKKALEILKIENEVIAGKKTERSSLRIGLSEIFALFCASDLAKEFKESLTLLEMDVGEVESKILASEIDFGVVFSPSPQPALEYLNVSEVKFNSYARADLLKRQPIAQMPFVIPATQVPFNPVGYKIRDGWPSDIPRFSKFAVSSFSIALELFRNGECGIYMPDFVAAIENQKHVGKFLFQRIAEHKKAETKRKIFLVKLKAAEESKDMKRVAKILRAISGKVSHF